MSIDLSSLETLGKVAGVAGVGIGAFLWIARDLIAKNIFPTLGKTHAYRIIRLIILLAFFIALAGIGAWVYVKQFPDEPDIIWPSASVKPVLDNFLTLSDNDDFEGLWLAMASVVRKTVDKDILRSGYQNARTPLMGVIRRSIINQSNSGRAPDGTPGPFTYVTMRTDFEHGRYLEVVSLIGEHGHWKVAYYTLTPCEPQCPPL